MEARPRKGGRSPSGVGADDPGLESSSPSSTSVHLRPEHSIRTLNFVETLYVFYIRKVNNFVKYTKLRFTILTCEKKGLERRNPKFFTCTVSTCSFGRNQSRNQVLTKFLEEWPHQHCAFVMH